LSLDLKQVKFFFPLIAHGRLFYSLGAAAVKALSPGAFFILVDGGANRSSKLERRLYKGIDS